MKLIGIMKTDINREKQRVTLHPMIETNIPKQNIENLNWSNIETKRPRVI